MSLVMSGLEGQLELPWLTQAARGPVTLEKDALGPDQLSPHTWPQAATSMANAKHPQMTLAYLTPLVLLENQECCLKRENFLPGFRRPLWGHRLWEQLD